MDKPLEGGKTRRPGEEGSHCLHVDLTSDLGIQMPFHGRCKRIDMGQRGEVCRTFKGLDKIRGSEIDIYPVDERSIAAMRVDPVNQAGASAFCLTEGGDNPMSVLCQSSRGPATDQTRQARHQNGFWG